MAERDKEKILTEGSADDGGGDPVGATGLDYDINVTGTDGTKGLGKGNEDAFSGGGVGANISSGAGLGADETTIDGFTPGAAPGGIGDIGIELGEWKEPGILEKIFGATVGLAIKALPKIVQGPVKKYFDKTFDFVNGYYVDSATGKPVSEAVSKSTAEEALKEIKYVPASSGSGGPSSGFSWSLDYAQDVGAGPDISGTGADDVSKELIDRLNDGTDGSNPGGGTVSGGFGTGDHYTNAGGGVGGETVDKNRQSTPESDLGDGYSEEDDFVPYTAEDPRLPPGTEVTPELLAAQENEYMQKRASGTAQTAEVAQATAPEKTDAATISAATIGDAVPQGTAATGTVSQQAQVTAAQTDAEGTQAATGAIQSVNEVAAAQVEQQVVIDAARATLSNEATAAAAHAQASQEFKAATAALQSKIDNSVVDQRATVQEQYKQLMDFGPNEEPPWAAGAMRAARNAMAARGITGSTIAGEAITMALMQAALPIAQQDAKVFQNMGELKLNHTAQIGILKASHLANLDVKNAEFQQQTSLQNASAALQIDMANLSNEQQASVVNAQMEMTRLMQNADRTQQADLANVANMLAMDTANLDAKTRTAITNAQNMLQVKTANLNARQQAASQNAKSFFDMDMANMSNAQQMAIVNNQSRLQAMMSDQAAQNAAAQFNATSENQTNQFFAGMAADISKFNAAQTTDVNKFNTAMLDAREQFNVRNALIVDQANVQWNRQINTQNTAVTNQTNMFNAQNLLGISNTAMANEITLMRDKSAFIFEASQNRSERALRLALAELDAETRSALLDDQQAHEGWIAAGQLAGSITAEIVDSIDWSDIFS